MRIPDFNGGIELDPALRERYARDASAFEVVPQAVVFPKDAADVRALVRFANANRHLGLSLTARAAGTDMSGGPLTDSFVVDFTRYMNKIGEVGYGRAMAEPGVYYRDFEKALAGRGFMMPAYTAAKDLCAVGGMVANNSGGEKTLRYGKTADYICRLDVVLSDGNSYVLRPVNSFELRSLLRQNNFEGSLYRDMYSLITENADLIASAKPLVSKNSAGYAIWDIWNGSTFDLTRLFSGSQGTLGMITGIQFRTVRPASHSRLLVLFLNDTARLGEIVEEGRKTGPESFESYDDHTLRLGMRYMLFRFGLRFLPEALMVLKNGRLPQLVLLLEFTGDSERETLNAARRAAGSLARFGCPMRITETPRDAEKYWAIRRESFNLLRTKIQGRRTVPFIDDIIVPPSALPRFLPELEAIIAPYKSHMTYTIAGHAGDGNFHIIPLMDLSSEPAREAVFSLADKVYDLVIRYKGSITAEHNDGIMRTPYLEAMYGSKVCALFARVKHIFDPHNIFNPHKKVGGTKEYAIRHLRRS